MYRRTGEPRGPEGVERANRVRSMNNLLGEVTFRNKLAPGVLRRPSSQLPFPLSHLSPIANVLESDKRALTKVTRKLLPG